MEWLAGMRMTEARMNDHSADEETTSGLAAATGWSINSFSGRKVNGVTTVVVSMNRTGGAFSASATGDTTNTSVVTLPVGWRPQDAMNTSFDKSGVADGNVTIATSGLVQVTSMSPTATINTNDDVTFFATWISENG